MPDLHGLATFPGVAQILSASMTFSHGITPSVCLLEIAPQDPSSLAPAGTLSFSFGGVQIDFGNCQLDKATYRLNEQGFVTSLQIRDRRWAWAFGTISGSYNILNTALGAKPDRQATLDVFQFRTAKQLAELCLKAMGESYYDISQIPENVAPLVEWDHVLPAQALADIAEQCGCRVVLTLDDTVLIARLGVGAALPTIGLVEQGDMIKSFVAPDVIRLVCDKTRFQMDFTLEPVGLDTDGTIKPINSLSYMPAGGWGSQDPIAMAGVAQVQRGGDVLVNTINPRKLAQATVWRWYRITRLNRNAAPPLGQFIQGPPAPASTKPPLKVPGYGPIRDLEQIALENVQVATIVQDGKGACRPAQVYGVFWDRGGLAQNTAGGTEYRKEFRINTEQQLVVFADPVSGIAGVNPNYTMVNPEIHLRTAFTLRDAVTWAWVRLEANYVLPGPKWGTGPKIVRHEDTRLEYQPVYDNDGNVKSVTDNLAAIIGEVNYYLQAAALEYQLKLPQEYAYAGLIPISPDGAIQQVSWQIGMSGTMTRAGRNTEFSHVVPPYKQRRLFEQFAGDVWRAQRDAAQAASRRLPGRPNPSRPESSRDVLG